MRGDKREQETARQVAKTILQPLKSEGKAQMPRMAPLVANLLDLLSELRARPVGPIKLHAHTLEEAVHMDESPVTLTISGNRSDGRPAQAEIHLPQPFTYLMKKLFAFRDRKDDADKNLGRHHALGLYGITAMQTEAEYENSPRLGKLYRNDRQVETARRIIRDDFAGSTGFGLIRLREHPLYQPDFPVAEFIAVLNEIFWSSGDTHIS